MDNDLRKPKPWATNAWPNTAKSLKGKRRKSIWSLALAIKLLLISVIIVFAVDGDFELDGDIQGGTDWASVFDGNGNPANPLPGGGIGADFTADSVTFKGNRDSTTFTGSAKNNDPIASWSGGEAKQITPKNELSNVYSYFKLNGDGDLLVYAGLERVDPGGDSHVDVEINQQTISFDENSGTFSGEKTANDLLLTMDFENGGSLGVFEVRKWNGTEWELIESLGGEGCNDDDTACAFNNSGDIDGGPWPSFNDKGNEISSLPQNAFTEMGVNVGQLIGNICFSTIQFHSRTSASFNSELKDFVFPQHFNVCQTPLMSETPNATNAVGNAHTFTVEVLKQEFTPGPTGASGVIVTAELVNSNDASATFVDDGVDSDGDTINGNDCETGEDGRCNIAINSATPGITEVTFSAEVPFNGDTVTLTRSATKTWVDAELQLQLVTTSQQIGDDALITAVLQVNDGNGWVLADGKEVTFVIDSGPGALSAPSCTTDPTGTCTVTLTNTDPTATGSTQITGTFNGDVGGVTINTSSTVSILWVNAILTLSPTSAANSVGDDHDITAKLQLDSGDGNGPVNAEGETITFIIDESSTAGNFKDGVAECITDSDGECVITIESDSIGVTTVNASWSGTLSEIPVDASATATKSWIVVQITLSPLAAANQVGNDHIIEAALQYDDGNGFQNVTSFTEPINFTHLGQGTLVNNTCDGSINPCTVTLSNPRNADISTTGGSQVSASWSGTVDIGGGAVASIVSVVSAGSVSKTWVDAQLTLEVITGSDIGTSVNDTHTVEATLQFDFGDGFGFVSAPAGEQIDFSIVSGPGILQPPQSCTTSADGTCTINLDFDQSSPDPGGIVTVEGTWTGNIGTSSGGDPVSASASASTQIGATFFSVQATVIDDASEIECDPVDDVPNSVFGPEGLDPSGTGNNLDPAYEIPSLVWPAGQAVVFNCLFDNEDRDVYWMAPTPFSREVYIGMTTNNEANYDIAVFVDLQDGDGNIQLEAVSLLDSQTVDSSGSMSSGSMSSGSMSSGSMSSGSMSSGSMSSGSMSSGSMSSGSMSSGSMSSGSMSSGSFNDGNGDELAAAHIEAGQTVFIVVLSEDGDFGPEYEMRVDVFETDQGVCTWAPQFGTSISPPSLPNGSGKTTGFFINIGRFEATYGTAETQAMLNALQNPSFLDDPSVQGVVIPIEQDPAVAAAYNDWNAPGNYCKIAKANEVADAIRNLIIDDYGDLDQIVIVGGPEMIPPHLVMEGPVEISPEKDYELESLADADSPVRWWLKQNRVPTYDFYVDHNGPFIRYLGNNLYQPEKPLGVLVETPQNIIDVVNNYNTGTLAPQSCLITAYEHLTDAGQEIDQLINLPSQTLISDQWTAANALNAFGSNPELVSFNGHFEHWRARPALGNKKVHAPEVISSMISNQVVGSTMGCHAGMNAPNNWFSTPAAPGDPAASKDDFAEVLLGNGWAAWYATMPYAYGDDEAFKYTEQIMFNFFKALDSGTGATVGEAYLSSKQEYFEQMAAGDFDIYDVKSIRGAVLYGLPFQKASIPLSVALDTLDPTISPAQKAALLASPDVDPGAFVTQSEPVKILYSSVSLYASNQVFNLEQINTPRGSYLRKVGGGNDDVVVSPGRPLQPLISVDLTGQPHGATLVSATYHDITDFDAIVTNPATDTTRLESLLSKNRWFPPSDGLWGLNLLGSTPRLNMIPGQYNTNGRVERVYDTMNLEIWESGSDSYHPPGIWHPTTTCDDSGNVTFSMKLDDADGIQMVNIAHNAVASQWNTTANLTVTPHPDGDGSFLAEGTFPLGAGVPYFVQAVDGVGNVNFHSNYGINHVTCTNPPDATNNVVDDSDHMITVELEVNTGSGWAPFPGLAQVSGLLSSSGLGDVDVLNCVGGACFIQISNVNSDGQTFLNYNDLFTVQPGEIVGGNFVPVGNPVQGSLSGDTPDSFTKEWWSGSVAVFKKVEEDVVGQICFTLTGSGINDQQCQPFAGPSELLFTWDDLPSGDDYTVTEAPPPAPLIGEGVIDEDIILDEGHRHALVRTVLNRTLTCDLVLDKQCHVPATAQTACDSKIVATLLRYTGPSVLGGFVEIRPQNRKTSSVSYGPVDLISGEVLAPLAGGFTIDANPNDLGGWMRIIVKDGSGNTISDERHHTSCSAPYVVGESAPLNSGGFSAHWSVVSFVERDGGFATEEQLGDQCVVGAGANVTYLYSLTNAGDPLTEIAVSDDKLGQVGTLQALGTGESQTLSTIAQVNSTVSNTATATGHLAPDLTCSAPADTITVTVGP